MAAFPALGAGDYIYLTLEDRRVVPNLREIVRCTARADAVLTIVRAQDGTVAQDFFTGSTVSARLNRAALTAYVSGAVAGEAAARLFVDTALQAQRDNDIDYINAQDAAEAAARIDFDNLINTNYQAADVNLQNQINTQASLRASVDVDLYNQIAAENAARASVDAALQAQRDSDINYINTQDAALSAAINSEASTRAAQDAAIVGSIVHPDNFVRAGTLTTDGAGAFAISFSPPFTNSTVMWSTGVYIAGGTVAAYGSLVIGPGGVSGVLLDGASNPLPFTSYQWYAIGYW
jgi:hypothetical protein